MTDKNFEKKLDKMSGQLRELAEPDSGWVEDTRSFLMSQIRSERVVNEKVKIPFWLRLADGLMPQNLALKPAVVFSLVLGLFLISSFATVNASKNSLPGSPLYNVKISAEKIRYILSVSEESKAKTSMEIARKRAQEFRTLAISLDNNNPESRALGMGQRQFSAQKVSVQLKSELDNVKNKLAKINQQEKDTEKAVAVAKEIDKSVSEMEQEMNGDDEIDKELQNNLEGVLAQIQDVKLAALAILETGNLEAGSEKLETENG